MCYPLQSLRETDATPRRYAPGGGGWHWEDSMNDMQRPAIDLVYDDLLATIEERDAALARVAELETALAAERAAADTHDVEPDAGEYE